MARVKFELDLKGLRAILRSDEMKKICKGHADEVANKLGAGYKTDTYTGKNIVNASISPASREAWKETLENNTILKALR